MNFIFECLCLGFVLLKSRYCLGSCEGNYHEGRWACVKNEGSNTLNVTYDCDWNSVQVKAAHLFFCSYVE